MAKTVLITGASTGIGRASAVYFQKKGWNVIGPLDVTRAVLPHFRKQKDSVLINISSVGGKAAFPLGALYHGTKFAVEGITESLSFELSAIGRKAKIVEPGTIATDFSGRSFDFQNDESLTEYQPMVGAMLNGIEAVVADKSRAAPPSVVAEVIYQTATDGTDRLRYTAGYDADHFLGPRAQSTDEEYIAAVKQQFGL